MHQPDLSQKAGCLPAPPRDPSGERQPPPPPPYTHTKDQLTLASVSLIKSEDSLAPKKALPILQKGTEGPFCLQKALTFWRPLHWEQEAPLQVPRAQPSRLFRGSFSLIGTEAQPGPAAPASCLVPSFSPRWKESTEKADTPLLKRKPELPGSEGLGWCTPRPEARFLSRCSPCGILA